MIKHRLLIQIFILYLPFTFLVSCSLQDSDISEQLERLMDSYHKVGQFQGAVLVSHNNMIIFEKGYGEANREWHIQNTVDTKFRLGSATKPFTAVLIMKLVEEGILNLSGKVSDYLPYYRTDTG
ncbi:MAG: serine hydrolase domain-containing protein, partial [Candidatus Hermodarchaeota archaeon]